MFLAWLFFGCVAGFGLGYIIFQRKIAEINIKNAELLKDVSILEQNSQAFEVEKRKIITQEQEKFSEIIKIKDKNLEDLKKSHEKQIFDLKNEHKTAIEMQKADYVSIVANLEKSVEVKFQNIATNVLKKESADLQANGLQIFESILKPVQKDMSDFKTSIENWRESGAKNATSLIEKISHLDVTTKNMMKNTEDLTKALKGDKKIQGNWGEMVIKEILEASGLIEGKHYQTQVNLQNEEGERQMPDFVINLPEGKHIILDSKVSLVNYEQHVTTQDERFLKEFITNVKNQIANLSGKEYFKAKGVNSPDFVIMCIPIEPAYLLAITKDATLYQQAIQKQIVLCGPSNLFAILQIVSNLWMRDSQSKNVKEIARRAVDLYKKIGTFISHVDGIGKAIATANDKYQEARSVLIDGRGSITKKLEDINNLATKDGLIVEGEIIGEEN